MRLLEKMKPAELLTAGLKRDITKDKNHSRKKRKTETGNEDVRSAGFNNTSINVFLKFVEVDKSGKVDASKILSKACYEHWLETRQSPPQRPQESFRRAVTAHVRAADGRRPFPEDIEPAVLTELRKKGPWKCFDKDSSIGKLGYKKKGYWEEKRLNQSLATPPESPSKQDKTETAQNPLLVNQLTDAKKLPVLNVNSQLNLNGSLLPGFPMATNYPSLPLNNKLNMVGNMVGNIALPGYAMGMPLLPLNMPSYVPLNPENISEENVGNEPASK
mmetsp:Transcript_285/g.298  ORF Transcript_285/g.298 Transcript_285/m.298 type:complete len:274 (-) Transcript_285:803-1624(-)